MFPTQYTPRERVLSNVGSRIHEIFTAKFDEKGSMYLEKTGEENIYDQIQSHADSVDINVLLKRYANGELDVLSKVQGVFADVTGMPRTYAEMLNIVNEGTAAFEQLPVETRAKFNHNIVEFLQESGTESWYEKLGMKKIVKDSPSTGETIVPDVINPEEVVK